MNGLKINSVRRFKIKEVTRKEIREFIEKYHYSKSINGCIADYCFALYDDDKMIGAMFYGRMAMRNQWCRFAQNENEVIELRRLCCVDDTPKNTESFFIGRTLQWLKKHTLIKVVVSYADAEYGHIGTIYRAANFKNLGLQKGARIIVYQGKKYHDKTIRTTYNGKLKPYALAIKNALLEGKAEYQKTAGKYCYTYNLRYSNEP